MGNKISKVVTSELADRRDVKTGEGMRTRMKERVEVKAGENFKDRRSMSRVE